MRSNSLLLILIILLLTSNVYAQQSTERIEKYVDVTAGVASYRGSLSLAYIRVWKLGEKRKLGIGFGGRFTSFIGANQYYTTAPAKLTSGSTGPLVFFKENIKENIDSLLVKSPQVNALNISINIDYAISNKFIVGFNIDAIGFSFGGSQSGNYRNGVEGKITTAKPTPFNILLVSDNDKGTLNSEFFVRYLLNDKWGVKLGAQFLFTEYTTKTKVQELPEENDRFRNKSVLLAIGVTYKL